MTATNGREQTVLMELPDVQCPTCKTMGNLVVVERFKITGHAYVAGVMTKMSATLVPVLVCRTEDCDFEEEGKR